MKLRSLDEFKELFKTNKKPVITFSRKGLWLELVNYLEKSNDPDELFYLGVLYEKNVHVEKDNKKAFSAFLRSAKGGHAVAQNQIGLWYKDGIGTKVNLEQAFYWFNKSAEQGNIESICSLGVFYAEGDVVSKDYKKAFELFNFAAQKGLPRAKFDLCYLYSNGYGVEKDLNKAIELCREAAESGLPYAQNRMAIFCGDILHNEAEAVEWERKAAMNGNIDGQFNYGLSLDKGKAIKQDSVKAEYWYRKAANRGSKEAQNNLGSLLEKGAHGVKRNIEEALALFEKAAQAGLTEGKYNLARLYYFGVNGKHKYEKAFQLFEECAALGSSSAEYFLAKCYEEGKGTNKDIKKALEYYKKSAEEGDPDAHCAVGRFYENGIGVQKDLKEAFKWYEKGSKCKEHPEILQFQLARCYENGIGTDKNLKRALEIYIDSAEKGCIDSMDHLADSYLTGTLTAIDKEEAEKWFRKAVDYGDDYARVQLANICFNKILGGYEAKKLVEEAAENGYAYAEYLLGYFYKYGEHYNKNEREAMIWLGRAARKGQKAAIEELKDFKYSN